MGWVMTLLWTFNCSYENLSIVVASQVLRNGTSYPVWVWIHYYDKHYRLQVGSYPGSRQSEVVLEGR